MGLCQTSWHTYRLLPTLNKTIPGHASRRTPTLRHPSLIQILKQQLGVDFVILAGYLKVSIVSLQRTACCWQMLSFQHQQCCPSRSVVY